MPRESDLDAVVIGGGHNGLVAANLLADRGWNVLVCEATPQVGGAVRSEEFVSPGFVSDLFSAFYPLAAMSPALRELTLEDHGLRWRHAPQVLAHILPDDRAVVLSRDVEETAASVAGFAPSDAVAWRDLSAGWDEVGPLLVKALFTPLPALRPAASLLWALGPSGALRFARTAVLPIRRFGEEAFSGEGAPLLLAGNALHADLAPESAGSTMFGWLLTMLGQSVGYPAPEGGSGRLVDALVSRLDKAGGVVRTSSPVTRVSIRNGAAQGVVLADGDYLPVRRAVIADVPAPTLYRDLVGESYLPAGLVRDVTNFEWDSPTLKLNWALRGRIPWTAEPARDAGTVHLGVDLDGLTRYAAALATREYPADPFVVVGQMTTTDPTRSPDGTESAWAYTHLPVGAQSDARSDADAEAVAAHTRLVEDVIERHAPGFRDLVIDSAVQSPTDLERENPSLVHGSINGGTAQIHQQLVFRPVPGFGGATTVIDRLYLASSSAHPGGGVHGGPGANAARAALSRDRLRGRGRRLAVRAAARALYPPRTSELPASGLAHRERR